MYSAPLSRTEGDTTIFRAAGANWQPYYIRPGVRFLHILGIGAGGGGGNGFTRVAGNPGGGGGGGGAGAQFRGLLPVFLLPKILWLNVGVGGAPATGGGATIVGLRPASSNSTNVLSAAGGSAGGNGTAGAAGSAGTGGGTPTNGHFVAFGSFATSQNIAGVAGGVQTGAVGANQTPSNITSGGAGGAGCTTTDFAGGNIVATGFIPQITGGGTGVRGGAGITLPEPFTSCGGAGGGSNNSGVAGNGGDAGTGSGGGGGGAGATGGTGGRGGDGIVFITEIC